MKRLHLSRRKDRARTQSPLGSAARACRTALIAVAVTSGFINLLMLVAPIFMLQVYDRVLPSRSVPTLVGLGIFALVMFAFYGVLEALRSRLFVRIGERFGEQLEGRVFAATMRPGASRPLQSALQPQLDLDGLRSFVANGGLTAAFDVPWVPIFLVFCFILHPWLGWAVVACALIMAGVAVLAELTTRGLSERTAETTMARRALGETAIRKANALHAAWRCDGLAGRWMSENDKFLQRSRLLYDRTLHFASASKALRLIFQSLIIGLGAFLVIRQEATIGVMLAASILSSRALAPIELGIANWRGFLAARQMWARLGKVLGEVQSPVETDLPAPQKSLRVTSVSIVAPGTSTLVVSDVSFNLEAGTALGIIGPTGAGKSTLVRALAGGIAPLRGAIRLDNATLDQWEQPGRFIGYLPQEICLFPGTIAENIAQFAPNSAAVIAAAEAAFAHDMIARLPDGYDTLIGEGGMELSLGQRQRIALARALYGDPFLLILDEPSANLDAAGEQAIIDVIRRVCERKGIVVVTTHRPSVIAAVDQVLILNEGRVQAMGPREPIMQKTLRAVRRPQAISA